MIRAFFLAVLLVSSHVVLAASPFRDVNEESPDATAILDLHRRGILAGRPDGTFGSEDPVNRAEAITIVVRAVANANNLPPADRCFPDVAGESWFVRPVCYARDLGWISGYPDGTFQPVRTVSRIEFLKILLSAYGVETDFLNDLIQPLAVDARDTEAWYMPFLAYAISSGMTQPNEQGAIFPGAALQRGQVALLLHRFLLFREGARTQEVQEILSNEEDRSLNLLGAGDDDRAADALVRMRLLLRGLEHRSTPVLSLIGQDSLISALEQFTMAVRLSAGGAREAALSALQQTYRLADQSDAERGGVIERTERIRNMAHTLAEKIRGSVAEPAARNAGS